MWHFSREVKEYSQCVDMEYFKQKLNSCMENQQTETKNWETVAANADGVRQRAFTDNYRSPAEAWVHEDPLLLLLPYFTFISCPLPVVSVCLLIGIRTYCHGAVLKSKSKKWWRTLLEDIMTYFIWSFHQNAGKYSRDASISQSHSSIATYGNKCILDYHYSLVQIFMVPSANYQMLPC